MAQPDATSAAGSAHRALRPVSGGTRKEEVVEAIRRALLAGELAPGQRVKEVELAAVLNVSRPTLREALHALIHEGALVQEPYKGIRVAETSPEVLLDLADVRVSLEAMAALRLAEDPQGAGVAALRQALDDHEAAVRRADPVAADLTHLEFHRTLWLASGNAMLTKIWPLVAAQIRMAMTVDQLTRDDPQRDLELHRRLVEVIESGDATRVRAEVDLHIRSSAEELVHLMRAPQKSPQQPQS
ncbi:GntR family transcriptional regulator [Streptomyces botrytidirepellens]|nr:GntR family transcriptional regulator [Streptomyces botrytidirepellens]